MSEWMPANIEELVSRIAAAIGQQPVRGKGVWRLRLPHAAPAALDGELCFAFPEQPALGLRLSFAGDETIVEPGDGDPRDTVVGSPRACLDFFENRRSSQALLLDRAWQLGNGLGWGAGDLDELADYLRALEDLLPAPYALTDDLRRRVRAAAERIGDHTQIREAADLDPADVLDRFVRTGTPVVLRGGAGDVSWWSFARLRAQFAGRHTHLSRYPNCSFALATCFERIESDAPTAFKAALPVTADLRDQCGVDHFFPTDTIFDKARALLVAPADARMPASYRATSWHRDWADNLLAELIGRKRVRLASPRDAEHFALSTTMPCHYNVGVDHSPIDPRDEAAYRGVRVSDVVLEPGDLLFIPCGWLHTVENLTATAAVNCWRIKPPAMLTRSSEDPSS